MTIRAVSRWLLPESLATSVGLGFLIMVAMRVVGLGRSVAFARMLSPVELGAWSVAFNFMTLLVMLSGWGFPGGVARYAQRSLHQGRLRSLICRCILAALSIPLALCAAGFWGSEQLAQWLFDDKTRQDLLAWTLFAICITALIYLVQAIFQGLRVSRISLVMQLAQTILFTLLGIAILYQRPNATSAMASFLIASLVVIALPSVLWWREAVGLRPCAPRHTRPNSDDAALWQPFVKYSLGVWGIGGLTELWRLLDRYLLLHFSGLDTDSCLGLLGSYHIVENVTLPLVSIAVQLSLQILPHVTHLAEQNQAAAAERLVQLSTKLVALMFLIGAVLLLSGQSFLLEAVLGDKSGVCRTIFPLALANASILAANYVARCYLLSRERTWIVMAATGAGLILNLALNLWLIPRYQLLGAAWSALVSTWFSTALLMYGSRRHGFRATAALNALVLLAPLCLLGSSPVIFAVVVTVMTFAVASNSLFSIAERTLIRERLARIWDVARPLTSRIPAVQ